MKTYYEDILGEEQNDFRKGRSCCGEYFTMKHLMKKHREFNVETHVVSLIFRKLLIKSVEIDC